MHTHARLKETDQYQLFALRHFVLCLCSFRWLQFCLGAAELQVLPDSEVRVVDTGEHDNFDVASYAGFMEVKQGAPAKEQGFAGTALTNQSH